MSRYALFAGARYYPYGGAHEFIKYGTIEELKMEYYQLRKRELVKITDWGQIVEITEEGMKILFFVSKGTKWKDGDGLFFK